MCTTVMHSEILVNEFNSMVMQTVMHEFTTVMQNGGELTCEMKGALTVDLTMYKREKGDDDFSRPLSQIKQPLKQ